ncbi:RiPP maturation radical SAM C-methyltransferase [Brevibacillus daliensis]|uniref:RiPP maturation radical SAM C-methyltransferase n=1 Tax=Brevibacillus daliensis TaxID=2892995 RepID=UPI001E3A7E60|nr:RiPP maturation radical SAM C-methyltransferase [Brevibacillus daliensis]
MKIALLNMPFGSLYRPSIGISLLQAALKNRDFSCNTYYLNLIFSSMISPETYDYITESSIIPINSLCGEWIFSESLYKKNNISEFQTYFFDNYWKKKSMEEKESLFETIKEIRSHVEPFLERVLNEFDWASYDIIGFTSVFEQNVASLSLAKRMKERWPHLRIIIGGANAEGEMGQGILDEFPFIDAVCSGEGDYSFVDFMEKLRLTGNWDDCDIKGIVTQTKRRKRGITSVVEYSDSVHKMDDLPYPNYDEYFEQMEKYELLQQTVPPRFLFESSRGCWWGAKQHCLFCGLNGSNMTFRSKTAERALDELLSLYERYSKYTNKASAVDNIIDMQYFKSFLPMISEKKIDLDMFYETKANLTKEQVNLFKEAGFHYIQPGIESMITSVLRLMNKGVSMLQNIQLLKWTKEFGVKPLWNFLYGFPGEQESEYQHIFKIFPALYHLDPPGAYGPIRLDRFSPYFNNTEKHGMTNIRPMACYPLIYQDQSREALMKMAYHFDFDYVSGQEPNSYVQELIQGLRSWQQSHDESEFFYTVTGEHLVMVDLRPIAGNQNVTTLQGIEKHIYQECDRLRSFKSIWGNIKDQGISITEEEVRAMLDSFVQRQWMVTEADVYVSLAIPLGNYMPSKNGLERLLLLSENSAKKEVLI